MPTTAEKEQYFRLRDKVIWDRERRPSLAGEMVAQFGEGPFEVVGLNLHKPDVIASGHFPVAVTIQLAGENRQTFDGAWFKKVPKAS